MKADSGELDPVQMRVEQPKDVRTFSQRSDHAREDQVLFMPPIAGREPFFQLPNPVFFERGQREDGKRDGPLALVSLQIRQREASFYPLHLSPDVQRGRVLIDVGPLQAE